MKQLQATDIILTLSTRPAGAFIQQQRGEFTLTISDDLEWKWGVLIIWLMAAILAIDDWLGWIHRKVLSIQAAADNWRLALFIGFTGMKLWLCPALVP